MWHGLEGLGWGWIGLAFLHLVLLIVLCISVLVAVFRRNHDSAARVREILRTRYAKGEITGEQFERLKRELTE